MLQTHSPPIDRGLPRTLEEVAINEQTAGLACSGTTHTPPFPLLPVLTHSLSGVGN